MHICLLQKNVTAVRIVFHSMIQISITNFLSYSFML